MGSQYSLLSFVILLVVYIAHGVYSERKRTPRGFRPIPKVPGWPLVGNTFQIGRHPQQLGLQWARKYGDICEVNLRGMRVIFLGTRDAIKEVFDKQSAHTSSRREMPANFEIISGGNRLIMMPYGDKWRRLRAIVHKATMQKSADSMRPAQEFEATQTIYDFLTRNEDSAAFFYHTRRYTTSVMMTVTYGKRMPEPFSHDIKEVYKIMQEMGEVGLPYGFLVDTFPALARLPKFLQLWRNQASEYYNRQHKLWTKLYNELLRQMGRDVAPQCFAKHIVDNEKERRGIDDTQAAFVAGSIIEAGSETTAGLLNSIWLYCAANPEVQVRANEELTRVVGDDRTPTFEEFENLPYVSAITKEVMRCRPVSAFVVAHLTTEDIAYKDYFIPKGTSVAFSQTAIHNDDCYEEPEKFKPERFLDTRVRIGHSLTDPDPRKRVTYGFGAGRRMCPGVHIAENSLYIVAAKVLWAFEIKPALDENQNELPVDTSDEAYVPASIVVPKPYKIRFVPRNAHRAEVVRREWETMQKEGYYLGDIKVDNNGMLSRRQ